MSHQQSDSTSTRKNQSKGRMDRMNSGKLRASIAWALCLSLSACQSVPLTGQPSSSAPLTAAQKPAPVAPQREISKQAESSLDARVISDGKQDSLIFRLAPQAGFRTQAFDTNQLRYIRLWVKGPGIDGQISGPLVDLLDPSPQITLSNIPPGPNRIVTAQYYDAAQNPLTIGVAKGFYSSGGAPVNLNLQLRRRFLPLAEIVESYFSGNMAMAQTLDLNALQAALDQRLFPGGVPGPTFATDPALLRTDQLASALLAGSGAVSSVNFLDPTYVKTTGSFEITAITGLAPGDKVKVRVGDPTSPLVEGNGTITVNNVLPGSWPVTITLPTGVSYTVDTGTTSAEIQTLKGDFDFTAGGMTSVSSLGLDYPTPEISQMSISQGPRGADLTIEGSHFHTRADANTINFVYTVDSSQTPATVISATENRLVLKVPAVVNSGNYNLQLSIGNKFAYDQNFQILRVWHVAVDGNPTANGADWAQVTTLNNALANAGSGDEIWLKAGTYKPAASDRSASFAINTSISLLGGFAGTELSATDRNPVTNKVYLSGDLAGNENLEAQTGAIDLNPAAAQRSDNSYHVVSIENSSGDPFGSSTDVVLDGLNIVGGNASDPTPAQVDPDCDDCPEAPPPDGVGGGILNFAGVTLRQVNLRYNSAAVDGAGLYYSAFGFSGDLNFGKHRFDSGEPLRPCLVEYNRAEGKGGGVYINGPSTLQATTFRHNQALNGGGLAVAGSGPEGSAEVYGNVFEANQAGQDGGGLYAVSNLENFRNIYTANTAGGKGGGLYFVARSQLGGGKFNVFAGNSAQFGGGMYLQMLSNYGGNTLSNWTFFQNQASQKGSGIYFASDGGQNLRLQNFLIQTDGLTRASNVSFIFENSLFSGAQAALVTDDGSFAQPALSLAGTNLFNTDPQFSDSANPSGGDGWGTGVEGLRPLSTSPAKGAAVYINVNTGDLDAGGTPRIGGNPTDIGAYVIP